MEKEEWFGGKCPECGTHLEVVLNFVWWLQCWKCGWRVPLSEKPEEIKDEKEKECPEC